MNFAFSWLILAKFGLIPSCKQLSYEERNASIASIERPLISNLHAFPEKALDAFRPDAMDVVVSFLLTPRPIFAILLDRKSEFLSSRFLNSKIGLKKGKYL